MSGRPGSEVRQRQHQVGVRLDEVEMAWLRERAQRDGVSPPEVLRRAFLRSERRRRMHELETGRAS